MPTLYQILGVKPRSPYDEVREAYRKLAREFHPDVNPDPKAHERMAQINVAFEILSDPVRRQEYDVSIGRNVDVERESSQKEGTRPASVVATMASRLRDHATPVYTIGFERASGRMVTSSFDNEVIWWNQGFRMPASRYRAEGGAVSALAVIGQDRIVAAGSSEQSVQCWTYNAGRVAAWRHDPGKWVTTVSPSPDGKNVAYGSVDRSVVVVRALDGIERFSGHSHKEAVTALAWSPGGDKLATGSADATVKVWSASTGGEVTTIMQVRSAVTALAFSPDARWLAVAAVDLSIRVFKTTDFKLAKTFFGHDRPIEALAFHPKNWLLGSASRDGSVGLWNVRHGIGHGLIEASHLPLSSLAFSPDGRHMVSGGLDKTLRVWRLTTPASAERN